MNAAGVRDADLIELTGDGHRELAVRMRQQNDLGSRDVWQVFRFSNNRIEAIWSIELRKETSDGHVEARLNVRRARRGPPVIVVSAGRAQGLDADNFREASAAGVEGILLPWGPIAQRVYQWNGSGFATVREERNRRHRATRATPRRTPSRRASRRARRAPERSTPRVDTDALIAAFKERAGIPSGARPRFRVRANLAEGREREELLVFGKHLVVVGPGFRRGQSWFQFEVPVADESHLLDVSSADLTGDGREEVILRVRRVAGDVQRELLLVQQSRRAPFVRSSRRRSRAARARPASKTT